MAEIIEVLSAEEMKKIKKAASNKKYYEAHKEQVKETIKKWVSEHKDDPKFKENLRNRFNKYYSDPEKAERKKAQMREYQRKKRMELLDKV